MSERSAFRAAPLLAPSSPAPAKWGRWLLVLTGAGLGLRLIAWSRFNCENDSYFFILMARNLLDHGSFGGTLGAGGALYIPSRTLLYKWLYPILMAPLGVFTSIETAGHLVALICGVLFVPSIFFATRAITRDSRTGLIAAALAGVSYSNAAWSGHVLAESLCTLLLTLAIWQAIGRGNLLSGSLLAGGLFGLAATTRHEMLLLLPVGLAATLASSRRALLPRAALFCLGIVLALAPVYFLVTWDFFPLHAAAHSQGRSLSGTIRHFWGSMGGHMDSRYLRGFARQEPAILLSCFLASIARYLQSPPLPRRYLAYAVCHIGLLSLAYNCFFNESSRYYTQLLPALIPIAAYGIAAIARASPARPLFRAARAACFLAVGLGLAAQGAALAYHGHGHPDYAKEEARIVEELAGGLTGAGESPGSLLSVSSNRYAIYTITGLPSTGYIPSRRGTAYIVGPQRDLFKYFIVVVHSHLRNTDTAPAILRRSFADRLMKSAHIPEAMDPVYKAQHLRFTDDLFEFYLLSRADLDELKRLDSLSNHT